MILFHMNSTWVFFYPEHFRSVHESIFNIINKEHYHKKSPEKNTCQPTHPIPPAVSLVPIPITTFESQYHARDQLSRSPPPLFFLNREKKHLSHPPVY